MGLRITKLNIKTMEQLDKETSCRVKVKTSQCLGLFKEPINEIDLHAFQCARTIGYQQNQSRATVAKV